MAYNKFKKLEQLQIDFGISHKMIHWLPPKMPIAKVSPILIQSLQDASDEPLRSEKAKSEYIITPVLKELKRNNPSTFSTFSGYEFDIDKHTGLQGFCDFILSAEPHQVELTAPIFCLVEAKKDNIENGFAQCGAEMYAATLFNQQKGKPKDVMYGGVTTAFLWCFLKLENNILYIDPNYVPLTFTEPDKVLSVLQWVLDSSLA